ncbi:unnamed protein product [Dicrocoelium dendriticum]|nr:unnamed protein product [Dicrocoelium dendriticum]
MNSNLIVALRTKTRKAYRSHRLHSDTISRSKLLNDEQTKSAWLLAHCASSLPNRVRFRTCRGFNKFVRIKPANSKVFRRIPVIA